MGSWGSVVRNCKCARSARRWHRASEMGGTVADIAAQGKRQRRSEQGACNEKAHESALFCQVPKSPVEPFCREQIHHTDRKFSV